MGMRMHVDRRRCSRQHLGGSRLESLCVRAQTHIRTYTHALIRTCKHRLENHFEAFRLIEGADSALACMQVCLCTCVCMYLFCI